MTNSCLLLLFKIDLPDKFGNTALHYAAICGANICAVTLLGYGCNPNNINKEGNTPLGLAVLHQKEACTLTFIQAKSDFTRKVIRLSSLEFQNLTSF